MKALPLSALLLSATAATATAHEYSLGALEVLHPHAIATVGNAPVGGGYLEIVNTGAEEDILISVTVGPDVAGSAELHDMQMTDGVMRMTPVEGGIAVPADGTLALAPGGRHVMFQNLPAGLAVGATFPATLTFEKAGKVEVVFNVEARGAAEADHSAHGD